jgi:anti-sigma regulatory factor (Ser/Thr protein kinase)
VEYPGREADRVVVADDVAAARAAALRTGRPRTPATAAARRRRAREEFGKPNGHRKGENRCLEVRFRPVRAAVVPYAKGAPRPAMRGSERQAQAYRRPASADADWRALPPLCAASPRRLGSASAAPGDNPSWVHPNRRAGIIESTEFQISGGPRAPETARAQLSERLDDRLEPPVRDDLRLLVSELVTNCVLHGGAGVPDAITVRTCVRHDLVRTEVCHDGPGFVPPTHEPDLESPGGLGLFLVEQMSAAWGIAEGCETCVWFELGLAA